MFRNVRFIFRGNFVGQNRFLGMQNVNLIRQCINLQKNISCLNSCTSSPLFLVENKCYKNFSTIPTVMDPCWRCDRLTLKKDIFFCTECGSIKDVPNSIDYFELLSTPKKFDINIHDLTQRFRQMQSLVHPDKFSNRNDKEQENSLEWSSLINKAYKTLCVPIDRGEYILKLQGITLPQGNTSLDKDFLMEMMERNEELEEASKDNILVLQEEVNIDLEEEELNLEEYFKKEDYENAKLCLVKMKYFIRLGKRIKEMAVKFGVVT